MFQTEVHKPQEIESNFINVHPFCSMHFSCFRNSEFVLHGDINRKRVNVFIMLSLKVGRRATKEIKRRRMLLS